MEPTGAKQPTGMAVHARTSRSRHNKVCNQRVPPPQGTQADHHTNGNTPADRVTAGRTRPPPYIPYTLSRPSRPRKKI